MVEWVATARRGSGADDLAQCVAGRAATRLGGAGESPADRIGAGAAPGERAARQALWGDGWVQRMAKRFGMAATLRPRGRPRGSGEKTPDPFSVLSRLWLLLRATSCIPAVVRHAPGAAAGAESAALAAECDEPLDVAGLAAHPAKAVLEPAALKVRPELLLDVCWQGLAPLGQVRDKRRVVLLHQPVETRLRGAVARVEESTGGFPAVGLHRLRVLAQAGDDAVWAPCRAGRAGTSGRDAPAAQEHSYARQATAAE